MSHFLARGCGAAVLLVVSAQGALADLSAQEVWSDWKSYLSSTGYEVSGTETATSGTLTVSDVSMVMTIPEEENATVGVTLPEIKFVENGDGTVNVLLPAEFPMAFKAAGDGDSVAGRLLYIHDGSPMVVSGDAAAMTYDYAAPQVTLTLEGLESEGEAIPPETASLTVTLSGVATKTLMTAGAMRSYDQSLTASSLAYDFAFKDPAGDGSASLKGALNGLSFAGTSTVPAKADTTDMAAMLAAGFGFDGQFEYESGNTAMTGTEGSETFAFDSTSQGGTIAMSMDKGQMSYDVNQKATELNISGSEIPFPLALSMAEAGFKLLMPVAKSDAEQDFALGVTLRDFAVPDMLWGMFDPSGVLPRDPATVVLDIAGKGKLLFDLFDPKALEAAGAQEPGELNALTVKQLLVSAAGARLTGTGDFAFNNDDLESFDGMPAPSGTADLQLVGANGLIDKLIEMGLLTDNDAMGARMMMGMFGVPGDGEDTLNSKIEIKQDGAILANGQRIK